VCDVEPLRFISENLEIHGTLWKPNLPSRGAVLFCHGAFETQKNWADFAGRLSQAGFTCLTFDFAGHGQSQGLPGMVSLRTWAHNIRDALGVLEARGCPLVGLVGWDSGGSAALLAAAHDARVCCAVILSAPIYLLPTLAERVAYGLASLAASLKQAVLHKPLMLSRLNEMKDLGVLSNKAANTAYFAIPEVQRMYKAAPIPQSLDSVWVDITGTVQNVAVPVRIIHGAEDKIILPGQAQKLYDLLAERKDLKIMDGCAHAVHLDSEKEAVYSLILDWMKVHL
jgi:alpha-beta hydrolase superfamily lysophospholipase